MTLRTEPAPISCFDGGHRFLSNFASMTVPFGYRGQYWPTAEHAYQAAKATDPQESGWIANAHTPYEAKRRGRQVSLRPDWDQVKRQVMLEVVLAKFSHPRHPDLRELLVATGDAQLIEGNSWGDDYWGAVPNAQVVQEQLWMATDGTYLTGRNWLGRILMTVRELMTPEQT